MALLKNPDQVRQEVGKYKGSDDPDTILSNVGDLINSNSDSNKLDTLFSVDLGFFKAISLNEFSNGVLMGESELDQFKTFAIDMMRQLQREYDCQTISEKATAELATMAYVNILELRWRMKESLSFQQGSVGAHTCGGNNSSYSSDKSCRACNRAVIELKIYENLGRELDRANRHYLTAIQTLKMAKQTPIRFNINANIGQNQIIQNKNG